MKAGWQVKTLGDVCDKVSSNVSQNQLNNEVGEYPIFGASGLIKNVSFYHRDKPYLSIVKDGSGVGRVTKMEAFTSVIGTLQYILPNEEVDLDYLNYQLMSVDFKKYVAGAAIPHIYFKDYKNESFLWMPLPEQQRIVAMLDQAFEGIAKARANAEQNLQNARALFESHLQSVFTERVESWVKKKLGETSILKIIDGDRGINYPSKEEFSDDGFCLFLNTKNVRPDGFNFDTTMFISEKKDKVLRNGKLQRQDVILTTRGTIGNVAIFDAYVEFENIRINSGMLIFRPNKEKLLSSFLFEVFRSSIMKDQMIRHVSGAAQPQLPIKTLIDFEIPVPDTLESQREIVASVREIDAVTRRLGAIYQRKLTLLDELKKSLLQQAFAGEL